MRITVLSCYHYVRNFNEIHMQQAKVDRPSYLEYLSYMFLFNFLYKWNFDVACMGNSAMF